MASSPFRLFRTETYSRWQVPLAAQRQIETEMKQLHPELDLNFEVIQSAAMAMDSFRVLSLLVF